MKALLVIDFINEIVSSEGKLSAKGYFDFIQENDTFSHLNTAIGQFREHNCPVVFVTLGFESGYTDQPKESPVFGKANEFGILLKNTWSTDIADEVHTLPEDTTLTKNRVSAFHNTGLTKHLRDLGVTEIYIAAVATDLAGEAAARQGHDLDFQVTMIANACAAANPSDHEKTLALISKIGNVVDVKDLTWD